MTTIACRQSMDASGIHLRSNVVEDRWQLIAKYNKTVQNNPIE